MIAPPETQTDSIQEWRWWHRNGLLLVGLAPLGPQIFGSLFNIFYNVFHVHPLLKADQATLFHDAIIKTNLAVYPLAVSIWAWAVISMRKTLRAARDDQPIPDDQLLGACRHAVNLPWWALSICAAAWLICIPSILVPLHFSAEPVDWKVSFHIAVSILMGGMIGFTQAFFAVELASQYCLFPVLFRELRPAQTPGVIPLTLRGRGVMWALSAVVCPIVCLLLLVVTPHSVTGGSSAFAVTVAGFAVVLGLASAWMLGKLVSGPINALRLAAREVAAGNFDANVDVLRADEFGPLIDEFNHMVAELRDKQHLQAAFGRHVGKEAARQILQQDPELLGVERQVTVMFTDVRNFTSRCSQCSASEVVEILNLFFTEMVEVIEEHHNGMVNKFLGDGFMAIFGVGSSSSDHADLAVAAAREMLGRLVTVNQRLTDLGHDPLEIGIGINTGPAIVGSIGSAGRGDYTAIGDTVNVAARVEALTKIVKTPIVLTAETVQALNGKVTVHELPPQEVKGKTGSLLIYGVSD